MKKLSEHIKETVPEVDWEVAKKVINACNRYTSDIRGTYCDICHEPITLLDKGDLTPYDFNYTCMKHRKYANHFQLDRIRKELNIEVESFIDLHG